ASHQWIAAARSVQFEYEAGVIVEAAAESGCEFDGADLDTASGEEAGPRLEQSERLAERNSCVRAQTPQFGRGVVRVAGDRKKSLDQCASLARQPGRRV